MWFLLRLFKERSIKCLMLGTDESCLEFGISRESISNKINNSQVISKDAHRVVTTKIKTFYDLLSRSLFSKNLDIKSYFMDQHETLEMSRRVNIKF